MKLKKKSTLIGAISVLAGVSVISVGFASWVVSAGDTDIVEGSISVENVSDQRHTLTPGNSNPTGDNLIVKYGVPSTAQASGVVLSHDNTGGFEHLNIGEFVYTVANWASANLELTVEESGNSNTARNWYRTKATGIIVDAAHLPNDAVTAEGETQTHVLVAENMKGYAAALHLGYVGALPSYDRDLQTNGTDSNDPSTNLSITVPEALSNGAKTVTFTLNFKWGSYFQGVYGNSSANESAIANPYTFYNTADYSGEGGVAKKNNAAKDAVASLTSIKNLLAGVEYKLTVETEHVAVSE